MCRKLILPDLPVLISLFWRNYRKKVSEINLALQYLIISTAKTAALHQIFIRIICVIRVRILIPSPLPGLDKN